jgi:excisionase family DNA binding protein
VSSAEATVSTNKRKQRPAVDEHALVTSISGTCVLLNASRDSVYDLIKRKELDSFLDGRRRKVTVSSIKGYIERRLFASKRFERARYPVAASVSARAPPDPG